MHLARPSLSVSLPFSPLLQASTGKMDGNPLSEIEEIVKTTTVSAQAKDAVQARPNPNPFSHLQEQHESNSRVDGGGGAENASTNGHGRSHDNNDEVSG